MIFDILENKLIDRGFVPGHDLFRNYMPADCSVGVMTRVPLQGIPIDPYISDYYKGRIQIIVRHTEPVAGVDMTKVVQKALTVRSREYHPASMERGEVNIDLFIPETLPITFPRLDGNGYEWSQHFQCVFTMKQA